LGLFVNYEEAEKRLTLEFLLKPCINVIYSPLHRLVLHSVVLEWKKGNNNISQYYLYKKRYIRSKSGLKQALDTLVECYYVTCKETEASTRSPKRKKVYTPTPYGVYLHSVLVLLYTRELARINEFSHLVFSDTAIAFALARENTSIKDFLPPYFLGLKPPQPLVLTKDGIKLASNLIKGFHTILYALNLLIVKSMLLSNITEVLFDIFQGKTLRYNQLEKEAAKIIEFINELRELIKKAQIGLK